MSTGEPRAAPANAATKVAGGQTMSSVLPAKSLEPEMILASSASDAASPFIFQLPATSGIILAAAIELPSPACGYQTRFGKASSSAEADPS
jgi:hypothetical protein